MLAVILLTAGCTADKSTTRIKFIMLHNKEHRWIAIEKKMKDVTPEMVLRELLQFPMVFPKKTKLLHFEVRDSIAYVDMNREFDSYNLGTTGIEQIIFSIVDTLCLNESLGVTGVQFLIEGKKVGTIGEFMVDDVIRPNITLEDLE